MIRKSVVAFALFASIFSLLPVFAQYESGAEVQTYFPRDDEIWKKWCQGTGIPGHACFHITSGSPDAFTVPMGRANQVIMSKGGHCVGYIDVKSPLGLSGCAVAGEYFGTKFNGAAGSGDASADYPGGK
ncbi:hypothetical protein BCV70DRAFT_206001 [Testicularia cyperi]|uniref:Uncharacterized protein n=1 Tax=Testicularia cyperi TaxID=1882483 RepID=A0A317XQG2_9BASI|nr:hypothetical protein BCV70DRAFT_206001 [Testicularia cyperi]